MFASRAVREGLKLPEIHLLINNRVSEYELRCVFLLIKHFNLFTPSLRSSKAFKAMGDTVAKTMYEAFRTKPEIFTKKGLHISDEDEFRKAFFYDLKDFHKTAIQR